MNTEELSKVATESRDTLITASEEFETRLTEYGVAGAHEWMFAIREVLYDLRRLDLQLCRLYGASDSDDAAKLLKKYAEMLLYEVLPHVQEHMTEVETELERLLSQAKS